MSRSLYHSPYLSIVILSICLAIFFILHPKIIPVLFPQTAYQEMIAFTKSVQQNNMLNPKMYWETREFSSPGYFRTNLDTISEENQTITSLATLFPKHSDTLVYISPSTVSIGGIITKEEGEALLKNTSQEGVLYLDNTTVIYSEKNGDLRIIFIKPVIEMKEANGFLQNYQTNSELDNEFWLEVTNVTQNPER